MASTQYLISAPTVQLEDPLAYLPRSAVSEYRKGEEIYGESVAIEHLYVVLEGKVMVSRYKSRERYIIIDIYQADELFGESVLLGSPCRSEQARAVEDSRVMSWTREELEQIISRQPLLPLAFIQVAVQRAAAFTRRIESLCSESLQQRLLRLLLQFAHRTGTIERDGRARLKPVTHHLMSRYLGTTREVVSLTMNRLKRKGYIRYSRAGIVFDPGRLQTLISKEL